MKAVLGAILNGQRLHVTAGQRAQFPAGAAHRWWNDGDDTLLFEGYSAPLVDLDRYLQAGFEVLNAGPPGRPPLFYMAHLAWRHRRTQTVLFAPPWVQAVLVPAVVLIGSGRAVLIGAPMHPSHRTSANAEVEVLATISPG